MEYLLTMQQEKAMETKHPRFFPEKLLRFHAQMQSHLYWYVLHQLLR
jgi:hypothetical protein